MAAMSTGVVAVSHVRVDNMKSTIFSKVMSLSVMMAAVVAFADAFVVTPYVQHPTASEMSIFFFTGAASTATVSCWPTDGTGAVQTVTTTGVEAKELIKANSEDSPWAAKFRHVVRFSGLRAGTAYHYKVALANGPVYANVFRTAPADRDTPVRFVAYSDSECIPPTFQDSSAVNGCTKEWDVKGVGDGRTYHVSRSEGFASNLVHMAAWQPDLFVIAGDLAARGGVQLFWDEFWKENAGGLGIGYGDPAGSVPILAVTGNHDLYDNTGSWSRGLSYDCNEQGEVGIKKFLTYFEFTPNDVDYANASGAHASERDSRDRSQLFHREDYGPVTLLFVDTNNETDDSGNDTNTTLSDGASGSRVPGFRPGTLQYEWLTNNLADAQATARFTFVVNHHCPYSRGKHNLARDGQCGQPVRTWLSDVMLRYGVTGWLTGHEEMQELAELSGTEIRPDGTERPHTVYVYNLGSGGDGLKGSPKTSCDNVVYRAYDDCADGTHYGHLRVEVRKSDSGKWECAMTPVYSFVQGDHSSVLRRYEGASRVVEETVEPDPVVLAHPPLVPYTLGTLKGGVLTHRMVGPRFEDDAGNVVYSLLTEKGVRYALGVDGRPVVKWTEGDGTPMLLKAPKLATGEYQVLVREGLGK